MKDAWQKLRHNKTFALVFRVISFLIGSYGLVVMLLMTSSTLQLFYFTIQTNIFVLILFAVLILRTGIQIKRGDTECEIYTANPVLQVGITFYITITMIIYWTLLSGQNFDLSAMPYSPVFFQSSNFILHTATPVFAILDWLLFLPHGKITKKAGLLYLLYPLAYVVLVFIRAEIGPPFYSDHRYPYPFLNVDQLGWPAVIFIVLAMSAGFLLLSQIYVIIDKRIAKKNECI